MPSGAGLSRLKKYLLLASTRRWNDKTCSKACQGGRRCHIVTLATRRPHQVYSNCMEGHILRCGKTRYIVNVSRSLGAFRNLSASPAEARERTDTRSVQRAWVSRRGHGGPLPKSLRNGCCAAVAGPRHASQHPRPVGSAQAERVVGAPAAVAGGVIATMACMRPLSASSQIAHNSFACLRHHAVLSGMLWNR